MDNISLELSFPKQEFIHGESIPFTVVLKNTGNESLTLYSFAAKNQSVSLVADDNKNNERIGTQMSWKERDGIHIDDPRQYKEFELAAGKSAELKGDGIEWLGDLLPGEYKMYAAYNSGVNIYTESEPVRIKIIPAKPVFHKGVNTSIRLAYALSKTVWLNKVSEGFEVYLLESSPNFPSNTFRNWKVIQLNAAFEIFPTATNTDPVKATHICWLDDKQEFNVNSISDDRKPGRIQKHRMNLSDAEIMESPFSDETGNLHALVSNKSGKEIIYIRLSAEGIIEMKTMVSLKNNLTNYSIMWDRDEILHFVWNDKNESDIRYLNLKLNGEFKSPEIKLSGKFSSRIGAIQLYQTPVPNTEKYSEHISVLTCDEQSGKWQNWIADIALPELRMFEILSGVTTFNYTIHSSALTIDNNPVYLFKNSSDEIYFYSTAKKSLEPLMGDGGKILKSDSQPELITTTIFSHKAGVYVRYISNQHEFKYLKME